MTESRETKDTDNIITKDRNKYSNSCLSSSSNNEDFNKKQHSQIINVNIISNHNKNDLLNKKSNLNNISNILSSSGITEANSARKLSLNTQFNHVNKKKLLNNDNLIDDVAVSSDLIESDCPKNKNNRINTTQAHCNYNPYGYNSFNSKKKDVVLNHLTNNTSNNYSSNNSNTELKDDLKALVQEAMYYKRIGNDLFNKKNYNNSIDYYKKALIALNFNSSYKELFSQSNINSIKIDCLNNIAICFLLKKEYDKVLDFTQQVSSVV